MPVVCNTAIPLNLGRFGSPTISANDVQKIFDARSINNVTSVMDHIKDWFCNTNRVKAKKYLYEVLHSDHSKPNAHAARIDAFFKLKNLCSPPFRENFVARLEKDGTMELLILKDQRSFFSQNILKNKPSQFESFNSYMHGHTNRGSRTDLHYKPKTMTSLLKNFPAFFPNENVVSCERREVSEPQVGLCKSTYAIITKSLLKHNRNMLVDLWHSGDKLYVGKIRER